MEYPQSPKFGCDMEGNNAKEYWEKYVDEYNEQLIESLIKNFSFCKKELKEIQSYDCLIDKYFKLIVEKAGLENGKIYYMEIPYSENYLAIDIYKNGTFSLRGYKYKDKLPYVGEIISKPLKLENDTELLSLMSIYSKMKYDNSFAKKLKESTCKPSSKFHLNILLDNKRIESINILESGTPTKYSSLTVRYLSDLMSDESKKIPFILELKGWKEEQTFTYYVREDRSLCSENKSFKDFDLLSEHKANDFFVLFYDFDLGDYSRYLRNTTELKPKTLFLVKMLECLGITFKIEENVNLDKLIIE